MIACSSDRWRAAWLASVATGLLVWPSIAECGTTACLPRQYYSAWEQDTAVPGTWKCYYFYVIDPARWRYECQACYWHNTDNYRNWVYYYNPKSGRFWGKCASPLNPQFSVDRPLWCVSTDSGRSWGPQLTAAPSVPGNPQLTIDSPPIPPTP